MNSQIKLYENGRKIKKASSEKQMHKDIKGFRFSAEESKKSFLKSK
jgi:hypothetical protein